MRHAASSLRMAMALLLVVTMIGPSPLSLAASAQTASARPAVLSGQELYKGLFFGQGRAAELLPEYWAPVAQKAAIEEILREPPDVSESVRALNRLEAQARRQGKRD